MTLKANDIVGKRLLVGITILDEYHNHIGQFLVHGIVIRADGNGIVLVRAGSDMEFSVPQVMENIHRANPGNYQHRSTGEVVAFPDFISSWTVTVPEDGRAENIRELGYRGFAPQSQQTHYAEM